nr:MAG TPA: coiled-coil domain-containing protein [Caudoviricetes sp.]
MKKLIPKLRLGTDKTTTAVNRIAIRQSDRGEKIHAFITTDTNEPYNLNNKYLVFKENKITGTAVRDNNVSITDASNGEISYTLHDAVHGADGVAWFDIVDSSNDQLIDSTADFYIKARDGLKFTALDVSYMSDLDKIKEELSKRISEEVDQQTADKLQQWKSNVDSAMQTMQQSYASIVDDFKQVKNEVDGYNQAVQNFNNRIDTTVSNANSRLDTVISNAKNRVDTTVANAESTLKNASDKANQASQQLDSTVNSANETLENLKQRTQKQEEDFNKTVADTNNKVDTAINKIPGEIDKNLNAKDARIQELQSSITKLKDDVTAFDGKTKKQFEDIENHIKEVSNGIAHLDLSNYATKEDLQKVQPDFSKIVLQTKILDSNNKVAYTEHALSKSNDGTWKAYVGIENTIPARVKNLCNKLPKIQENIGNLQTTKADKSELSNYATKTDLNNKTERPLFEAMLQNYATKNELNSHQVDFSKLIIHYGKLNKDNNYIRSDEYKATKDEKGNFVFQLDDDWAPFKVKQILTKDLPKINQDIVNLQTTKADRSNLSYYATKNELDIKADRSELSNKADRSELSNYATTGDINSAIQNVRIKQDSLDSSNNFTSGKIYSPNLVDGHLTFDMSDSYATYKTKTLTDRVSAMQEQITQLQLEVKKKIDPDIGFMLQGRVEDKDLVFNIGNIADISSKKWILLVFNSSVWDNPDNRYYQLKSVLRSDSPFSLLDSSVKICSVNDDYLSFEAEHNDEQFRIKKWSYKQYIYLTLVQK